VIAFAILATGVLAFYAGVYLEGQVSARRYQYRLDLANSEINDLMSKRNLLRQDLHNAEQEVDVLRSQLPATAGTYREQPPSKSNRCNSCWRRCPHCARDTKMKEA
jgi:hypothetical protein